MSSLKDSNCISVWISNHVWILNGRRYNKIRMLPQPRRDMNTKLPAKK
jgi:hypothetical protein